MEIDLGRLDGFVSEPERNDGASDAILQKHHRRRVAQAMRGDMLAFERRTALGRQSGVFPDDALDRITTETAISVAPRTPRGDGNRAASVTIRAISSSV